MTRIIIDGLRDRISLINAISVVLEVFNHDDAYTKTEHRFVPEPLGPIETTLADPMPMNDDPLSPDPAAGLILFTETNAIHPLPKTRNSPGTHRVLDVLVRCDARRGARTRGPAPRLVDHRLTSGARRPRTGGGEVSPGDEDVRAVVNRAMRVHLRRCATGSRGRDWPHSARARRSVD